MKNFKLYFLAFLALSAVILTGCELVGDVLEAGMWTALIIILLVVFLLIWIFRKLFS